MIQSDSRNKQHTSVLARLSLDRIEEFTRFMQDHEKLIPSMLSGCYSSMNVNLHNFKDLDPRLPKFDTTKEYIPEKRRAENAQKAFK